MLLKSDLKQLLLTKFNFIDNKFLDLYLQLIYGLAAHSVSNDQYTEWHHSIPVSSYKCLLNLKTRQESQKIAEKDPNNFKVKLLYKDHCLAHYYLYECTTGQIKAGHANCYLQMIYATTRFKNNRLALLSEFDFQFLQNFVDQIKNSVDTKYYSERELDFLVKNVSTLGTIACADILQRPRTAISRLAVNLGLVQKKQKIKHWTEAEKIWLVANSSKFSRACCANYLNKSEAAIHAMEQRLGISSSRKLKINWSTEDDAWLLQNYQTVSTNDLVRYLNRSVDSIRARLKVLGVQKVSLIGGTAKPAKFKQNLRQKWTESDRIWLKANYPQKSIKECADYLNRSESSVEHAIDRLELKVKKYIRHR